MIAAELGLHLDPRMLPPPPAMAVEEAFKILDILEGDLEEACDHVVFLAKCQPQQRSCWRRVLWCLTSQGNA